MKKRKPMIGVTPQTGKLRGFEVDATVVRLFPEYLDALLSEGGLPVILPFALDLQDIKALVDAMDGFVFTGGMDVGSELYQREGEATAMSSRDQFEMKLLSEVIRQDKPILGICRGLQIINVALGGTLYPDLEALVAQPPIDHDQSNHLDLVWHHTVAVEPDGLLRRICGKQTLKVNSLHHQGVRELGRGMSVEARSADGLIEAARMSQVGYGLLVQWHPELIYEKDPMARLLFHSFLKAAML
jgi:putative glutamine amidotransferase